jgi:hypothetical protein
MIYWIPVISPFLDSLAVEDRYETLCIASTIFAIICFVFFMRHPLRIGKLYRPGTARLGVEFSDSFAGSLVNLWAIVSFLYTGEFFWEFRVGTFQGLSYIIVHLYRALCHSFFRSEYSSPWPLESVLFVLLQKAIVSILSARVFVNGLPYIVSESPIALLWYCLFLCLFVLQVFLDSQLARLRVKGDRGYRIPVGFFFDFVSCPSHLCEVLMWVSWGMTFSLDFGIIAIWLWQIPMVWLRAAQTHQWYHRVFKGAYPKRRRAFIPFVELWTAPLPHDL